MDDIDVANQSNSEDPSKSPKKSDNTEHDVGSEVLPEVTALWAPILPRWEESGMAGQAIWTQAKIKGYEVSVSRVAIDNWRSGKTVPSRFEDYMAIVIVFGLERERDDWKRLYEAAKQAKERYLRDRPRSHTPKAAQAESAATRETSGVGAERPPPPLSSPEADVPKPHSRPRGQRPRAIGGRLKKRPAFLVGTLATLLAAWMISSALPIRSTGETPDPPMPRSSTTASASSAGSSSPLVISIKQCAHVAGEAGAGVYEFPDDARRPLRRKEPYAPITVLPRLGVRLHAPPGWLVVSTPRDSEPYRWMRASDLSRPGRCPDPEAIP